jgi:hypothetical protein
MRNVYKILVWKPELNRLLNTHTWSVQYCFLQYYPMQSDRSPALQSNVLLLLSRSKNPSRQQSALRSLPLAGCLIGFQSSTLKTETIYSSERHIPEYMFFIFAVRPPLWSSGQSSWLQIQRPRFDSRRYQKKK